MEDEEYRNFQLYLMTNPEAGNVIPHSEGLRKVRWASKGKGKRGGLRIIYYNRLNNGKIWLLAIYAKGELEDLTIDELKLIRKGCQMTNKKRNLAQEIIEWLRELKAGGDKQTTVEMPTGVRLIRAKTGMSQAEFAECLKISVRTLQEWEQGRAQPTGPALSLLDIVEEHPDIFVNKRKTEPEPRRTA